MTVFRKVSVKERLPTTTDRFSTNMGFVYFFSKTSNWQYPDEVEWWLEEVPVPSIDEINAEADRQFPAGRSAEANGFSRGGKWMYNRILRKLL